MNKFIKKRNADNDTKAEVKVEEPKLTDNLPPTPRERRDLRRKEALDLAEASVEARRVRGNGKVD